MTLTRWMIMPGMIGGALALVALLSLQRDSTLLFAQVRALTLDETRQSAKPAAFDPPASLPLMAMGFANPVPELGDRRELTYEQWVQHLAREADIAAQQQPAHLSILAGDSLSLWFPAESLPSHITWLNQGISGETSYGLLRRVKWLDRTQPKTIFIMIGINDLIRGIQGDTILENQREIVRHLKTAHPTAKIVIQSILPHGGERASERYLNSVKDNPAADEQPIPLWVKRIPEISNASIQRLNQRLALVAREEQVQFLDLHGQFANDEGNLRDDLTTDGLHLSPAGYALWRSHLSPFLPAFSANQQF